MRPPDLQEPESSARRAAAVEPAGPRGCRHVTGLLPSRRGAPPGGGLSPAPRRRPARSGPVGCHGHRQSRRRPRSPMVHEREPSPYYSGRIDRHKGDSFRHALFRQVIVAQFLNPPPGHPERGCPQCRSLCALNAEHRTPRINESSMSSEWKTAANGKNAKKSTRPKSVECRNVVSRNALKQGGKGGRGFFLALGALIDEGHAAIRPYRPRRGRPLSTALGSHHHRRVPGSTRSTLIATPGRGQLN